MFRRGFLAGAAGFGAVPAALGAQTDAQALPGIYPVTKFGAVADGVRMDTQAIHAAIEACARGGGGTVPADAPGDAGARWATRVLEEDVLSLQGSRITSYNVCYTKLLR